MRIRSRFRSILVLLGGLVVVFKIACDFVLLDSVSDETQSVEESSVLSSVGLFIKKKSIRIAYLHVGKTGGAAIRQTLRNGCFPNQDNCRQERALQLATNETMISKLTRASYHGTHSLPRYHAYNAFVVSVRNPINRMASWFTHQHPLNKKYDKKFRRNSGTMVHISSCWRELDEFCQVGLGNQNISGTRCEPIQARARDCVRGRDESCGDMFFNYEYYTHAFLNKRRLLRSTKPLLFVIRTEQMWHDWMAINEILGETLFGKQSLPVAQDHQNGHRLEAFPVYNRTLGVEGLKNACRLLCHEIQMYKSLLNQALNLDENMEQESLRDLHRYCPEQTVIESCLPVA